MQSTRKARIVRIGNARGVRIPKEVLDQLGLVEDEAVDLEVREGQLVIRPSRRPRSGWAEQFRLMAERGDDRLLDAETTSPTRWDADEWQW